MKNYTKIRRTLLKKFSVRNAYQELGPEYVMIRALIQNRIERGLTQAELASKIGTKQSAIARLESGNYNPTIRFLGKIARALRMRVSVTIS